MWIRRRMSTARKGMYGLAPALLFRFSLCHSSRRPTTPEWSTILAAIARYAFDIGPYFFRSTARSWLLGTPNVSSILRVSSSSGSLTWFTLRCLPDEGRRGTTRRPAERRTRDNEGGFRTSRNRVLGRAP